MKYSLACLLILVSFSLNKVAPATQANPLLGDELENLTSQHSAEDVQYGILVHDLETGRVVYAKDADLLLNPASNAKVLTTFAALALLGPDYRFKTQILGQEGKENDKEDKGRWTSLTLKGFGDPMFNAEQLDTLVGELKKQGLRQVDEVFIDGSYFDGQAFPGQMEGRQRDSSFNCSVGALSLDHNQLLVRVSPGSQVGAPAEVQIQPHLPGFPVSGEVATVKKRGRVIVRNDPEAPDLGISVKGAISLNSEPMTYKISVHHPLELAGLRLVEALRAHGIAAPDRPRFAAAPTKSKLLVEAASPRLSEILQEINKRSDNFMAEQLTKALGAKFGGAPGTTEKGVAVILKKLREMGVRTQGIDLENGSGLSKKSRLRAETLVETLTAAYQEPKLRVAFISSLSVLGVDGTLRKKFRRSDLAGRFLGKTGTLNGVSSLSGYVYPKNSEKDHPFIYAFIVNGKGKNFWKEKQLGQDILQTLLKQ